MIFGVPGAFTPVCQKSHLPTYLEKYDALKAKGVDSIICVGVNDAFVFQAWRDAVKAGDKIRMLSDPQGKFVKSMGLNVDLPPLGGIR